MSYVAEERYAVILEEIDRRQALSIRELSARLGVSRETVRKDLRALAERRLVRQVRGGAVLTEMREPPLASRRVTNTAGKQAIARTAAGRVPEGASVILDSGSTTQALAELLAKRTRLTVYTNDLTIALMLRGAARRVHLIGGVLSDDEDSTHGLDAIAMLSGYRADLAFIGVGGLFGAGEGPADRLFADFTREAASLRGTMIECAGKAYLLADHTKFAQAAPARLPNGERVAGVLTDRAPPARVAQALSAGRIELSIAAD